MQKILEGKVVSVKMQKTAVVEVARKKPHPLYRKILKRSKKIKADTGNFELKAGDKVRISETRPISKDKHFKVVKIIK